MEINPKEQDRRKLKWLSINFVCYFLVMVYALPHAALLPPRIFVLCGVLNFAIIGAFVFSIRKVYLRMKGLTLPAGVEVDENTAKLRMEFDRRRLKWLGMGAGLYSLISSMEILAVFVLEIRKVYHRLESGNSRQS